jgi:UDP-glucose 4-epimerase
MPEGVIVVTGGAGFIGSHLVDLLLANNYRVRVIDNLAGGHERNIAHHYSDPNFEFINLNILNLEENSVIFSDAKYVFHFAGLGDIVPSIELPFDYMNTNIIGTVRVLECARNARVDKFIYAASSSCYGIASVPTNEKHPINPLYPYALSKFQGEQAVLHWHAVYKLPVNSIRIFNAYGPRSRTTGAYGAVFGVFIKQKLAGKPLTVVGDGNQERDFIYVTDLVKAFYMVAKLAPSGEIYNLGTGSPKKINELVKMLESEVVKLPKRPGEPDITCADITKITSHVGWTPEITFEFGVNEMLNESSHWSDAPLWDPDSISDATKTWFKFMS